MTKPVLLSEVTMCRVDNATHYVARARGWSTDPCSQPIDALRQLDAHFADSVDAWIPDASICVSRAQMQWIASSGYDHHRLDGRPDLLEVLSAAQTFALLALSSGSGGSRNRWWSIAANKISELIKLGYITAADMDRADAGDPMPFCPCGRRISECDRSRRRCMQPMRGDV
jgi:hypothetical protein